jgi:hypothetical protein
LPSSWEPVTCCLCVRIGASKVVSHSGHAHKHRHLNSVTMYLLLLWACPYWEFAFWLKIVPTTYYKRKLRSLLVRSIC